MAPENSALWLAKRGAPFTVGPAPYTQPKANEIVVRVRAVGLNLVDGIPGFAYRFVLPWLTFPAVVGGDVAGEIVEVGPGVTRFSVGQRVLGMAAGSEQNRNTPAEGSFQHYVVMMENLVSPIPDPMPFADAAVLPLQLSTAATGLFQQDHLGLALPVAGTPERNETVLVWGGSTGVGCNAIQLARNAGYRVIATSSPHNFGYLRSLGADAVVDRSSRTAVAELIAAIGNSPLAGTIAIGRGSLPPTVAVAARVAGSKRVVASAPENLTRMRGPRSRRRGVQVTGIWGGSLKDNEVGGAIYNDFLPNALAVGTYRAAPLPVVFGDGLDAIPAGLERLSKGLSAQKLVITV
jgi:NADPH:quinone reductase-like Zn-dependent oxidoreductase